MASAQQFDPGAGIELSARVCKCICIEDSVVFALPCCLACFLVSYWPLAICPKLVRAEAPVGGPPA